MHASLLQVQSETTQSQAAISSCVQMKASVLRSMDRAGTESIDPPSLSLLSRVFFRLFLLPCLHCIIIASISAGFSTSESCSVLELARPTQLYIYIYIYATHLAFTPIDHSSEIRSWMQINRWSERMRIDPRRRQCLPSCMPFQVACISVHLTRARIPLSHTDAALAS